MRRRDSRLAERIGDYEEVIKSTTPGVTGQLKKMMHKPGSNKA